MDRSAASFSPFLIGISILHHGGVCESLRGASGNTHTHTHNRLKRHTRTPTRTLMDKIYIKARHTHRAGGKITPRMSADPGGAGGVGGVLTSNEARGANKLRQRCPREIKTTGEENGI